MEQIIKVLTLYDILACLLPGLLVVWSAYTAFSHNGGGTFAGSPSEEKSIGKRRFWIRLFKLLVVAYITGQLLQTVLSERRNLGRGPIYLRSIEEVFPPAESADFAAKKLRCAVTEAFGNSSKDSFYLCKSYLQVRKLDAYIDILHERYGFFRGLFVALTLSAIILLFGQLVSKLFSLAPGTLKRDLLLASLLFVGAAVSVVRMRDYDVYYAKATYETFYVDYRLLNPNARGGVDCPPD